MFAVVDIEASGSKFPSGRIIDIAIVLHDGHSVLYTYNSLVNPGEPITDFYSQLTGITNKMLAEAPKFEEIAAQVYHLLEGNNFVAHNVSFDYNFLRAELAHVGYQLNTPRLCSFKLAQKYLPGHRKYGLTSLAADFGIEIKNQHRALDDALATAKILEIILEKYQIETSR